MNDHKRMTIKTKKNTMIQPQAIEIEQAVLGACLVETTAMAAVSPRLREEMFYDHRHKLVYAAMQAMHAAGRQIDILTVCEELRRRGELDNLGGPFFVTSLSATVAGSAHLIYHAQVVHEKYIRRRMILGFNKLFALSADDTTDPADTLGDAYRLLDEIENEFGRCVRLRDMDQLMRDTLAQAEIRREVGKDGVTGIPTGFTELDRITGGWQNGDLITVAARPSVGKTAFALHLARQAALAGHQTVIYSIEMAGERLGDRLILAQSGVDAGRWRNGQMNENELVLAAAAAGELSNVPIRVDDSGSISMDYICAGARMLHSKGKCSLVIIDYLQLSQMKHEKNRNREQEVAQAAHKAKMLARELNIPVILLSQLNRESENRPNKRPVLADLRESGGIEQDSDVVLLLYRPALAGLHTDKESGFPSDGLGVAIVAKHRNGETGNVYFGHNPSMTRMGDYVPSMQWMQKNAK